MGKCNVIAICKPLRDKYDFILIDCMPSLGMITLNALTAADEVIIPVQAQYLPAKGMTQLMKSISLVKSHTNENLKIAGIVMTLVDSRTNLAKDVIDTIRTNYGMAIKIFDAQIPIAVKAAEAAKNGQSIFAYDRCGKSDNGLYASSIMLLCFSKTHIRSNRPYNSRHRHNGRKGKQAEAFKG